MTYCNQCGATCWQSITDKDVYGQEPVEDIKRRFNESLAKNTRLNPIIIPFTVNTATKEPQPKQNHYMKPILQIIRGAAVVIAGIAILTITAKIVVTGVTLIWNLW